MKKRSHPTSVRLSPADVADVDKLIENGVYVYFSDAVRDVIREGIKTVKKERGLA